MRLRGRTASCRALAGSANEQEVHVVRSYLRVGCHEAQSFQLGLRNQQAVERVAMVVREYSHLQGVRLLDGQRLDAVP